MTVLCHFLGDNNFDGDLPKKLKNPQVSIHPTLQTDRFSAEKSISTSSLLRECCNTNNRDYNVYWFRTSHTITLAQIKHVLMYSWFQTFAVFWMLYAFFWVIPRHLNFICQRFGTLCLFHLHRQVGTYQPMKMGQGVPKLWPIKFRRRGVTQKKTHNMFWCV
jgi:hypothetical protein